MLKCLGVVSSFDKMFSYKLFGYDVASGLEPLTIKRSAQVSHGLTERVSLTKLLRDVDV